MRVLENLKRSDWAAVKANDNEVLSVQVERRGQHKPAVLVCAHATLPEKERGLKSFVTQHKLRQPHGVLQLNRGEYRLIQTEAVDVPPEELKQALRWRIKDMLDYPVSRATLDVLDIPADPHNSSRARYMLAVVARQELIREKIVSWVDDCRMRLQVIDVPEMGQRNIATLLEQPERALALLSFSEEGGLLTISAGGELFHAAQLTVSLALLQNPDDERRSAMYDRVALDLQRTLDNFERQFPYISVGRLLLAPFPMRDGLLDYLKSYLYLPVDAFALSDVFDLQATPELADLALQARFFTMLGLALREKV